MGAPVPPVGAYAPPPPRPASAAGLEDNAASALCYVLGFITGILFLVLEPYKNNRTIKFHAFQSIFLSVGVILIRIVLTILFTAVGYSMGLGMIGLLGLFSLLVSLAFFALWLFMIISAYQGKQIVLPIIGPLAQQQAR